MIDSNCIFCQIALDKAPAYKIYEDDDCLAFLDVFPNTEGFSLVIPKDHYQSDFSSIDSSVFQSVIRASQLTAQKIVRAYESVERCGLVFEGLEIDHLHAKIIPLHQSLNNQYLKHQPIDPASTYFEVYPGYLTLRKPDQMADVDFLKTVAHKINQNSPSESSDDN